MTFQDARKISIVDWLSKQGIEPINKYPAWYWYHAPYRHDNKPSFKVCRKTNRWIDVAFDQGGSIVDLVMLMQNVSARDALSLLENEIGRVPFFSQGDFSGEKIINIKKIKRLENRILINYLNQRCISHSTGLKFLNEAYYTVENKPGKQYFALAFANDAGGYELRNSYWKGCSSKEITTIPGNELTVNVFEGFFDFLAAYEYHSPVKHLNRTIVLNSTANINRAIKALEGAERINLYLDNDRTGEKASSAILEKYPIARRRNYIYQNHEDFAEFWANQK